MDVKKAIETGDVETLRRLLAEDNARANALISWGREDRNLTHPLHYISDMIFEENLEKGSALPLAAALVEAGADVDFQASARSDSPLIGAASLGAEDVGLALLDAGANPQLRGIFGETALHWAAHLGEERLAARLIEVSELDLKDEKYEGTPLDWAIHGRHQQPSGNQGKQREVAALLVSAGATVETRLLASEKVLADPELLAALTKR